MRFFDLNLNSGWKISQSLLLITINSHVIIDSRKRLKDQSLTKKGKGERRLHTGIRFQNEETRRVSEQTSPQVARAAGHPVRENVGGLNNSSSSIRRFYFRGSFPSRE